MQNRFLQKKFANGCGIPTTDFRLARNHRELVAAHRALGFPGVLKLQFGGPEAEGPWVVRDFDDVPRALQETKGRPLLWERFVDIDAEFTVFAERKQDGTVDTDPQPRIGDRDLGDRARAETAMLGERLGIVGAYHVRFFQSAGQLLFDELVIDTPGNKEASPSSSMSCAGP